MSFKRNLGLPEAVALSTALLAPTLGITFGIPLVVQSTGVNTPISFIIAAVAIILLGLIFAYLGRKIAGSGSAYDYVGATLGPRAGFVSGWMLLLAYVAGVATSASLAGFYIAAFLGDFGVDRPHVWLLFSLFTVLLAVLLSARDMRLATRAMLLLEGISMLAILFLCVYILLASKGAATSVHLHPAGHWPAILYGVIPAIFGFVGFEAAATLGEETRNPRTAIPLAIVGTAALGGSLFVLAAFAVISGYGVDHLKELGEASSPISTLGGHLISTRFSVFIDFTVMLSAIGCVVGSLSAAARMLHALAFIRPFRPFGQLDATHGTPVKALAAIAAVNVAGLLAWHARDPLAYAGFILPGASIAFLLVYMSVAAAEIFNARAKRQPIWIALGVTILLILMAPLGSSLFTASNWVANLPILVVLAWLSGGVWTATRLPARGSHRS